MVYRLSSEKCREVVEKGSGNLANYCQKNNLHYVVTGSSGGLDSAVTLGFAKRACELAKIRKFPLTSIALIMPCQSNPLDSRLGRMVAEKFGAKIIAIDLNEIFANCRPHLNALDERILSVLRETGGEQAISEWAWSQRVAQGNIKARLRMMIGTYHVARMTKGMVLSTDNLSEYWMAFWTICGDVGDFAPIQQIMKGLELYDVARYLGVPDEILAAKPTDGLGISECSADQLGADLPTVDKIMVSLLKDGFRPDGSYDQLDCLPAIEGVQDSVVAKVAGRCLSGAYKRHIPFVLTRAQLGLPPVTEIDL